MLAACRRQCLPPDDTAVQTPPADPADPAPAAGGGGGGGQCRVAGER